MKMKTRWNICLVFLIVPCSVFSQVIMVKQDGTGDTNTIQAGIDLSLDGDTILVWPGIYIENVVIDTKNVTLGSLTLTTGDSSYIYQTIIDGNMTGSCLKIMDGNTGVNVCGFTLQNGSGSFHGPINGGGMLLIRSKVEVKNCFIQDNKVTGDGGGINCYYSDLYISGTKIRNNHACLQGGGIYDINSTIEFDTLILCDIYENYAGEGTDFYKLGWGGPVHIVVDTFTVMHPDYYYLFSKEGWGYPGDDITWEINAGKIEQVDEDLFVSPWGDNSNSGLIPSEPLKDISFALLKMASDSITPDTIHLSDGIYAPSTDEKFPLSLKAYTSIKGESRDSTILDGEGENYILNGIVYADHYQVSNMTVMNGYGDLYPQGRGAIILLENNHSCFSNMLFRNNQGWVNSCGHIWNSNNFSLDNVEFIGNSGGAPLLIGHANTDVTFYDTVRLYNCRFTDNQPTYIHPEEGFGGGLNFMGQENVPSLINGYVYNGIFDHNFTKIYPYGGGQIALDAGFGSKVNLINCTFGDNSSENPEGANIGVTYNSDMYVYNSIMYGNDPAEFYMYAYNGDNCSLSIYNSLVAGGEEGIRILSPWNDLYYDETNLDTDPLWDTSAPWPYSLTAGSPCINAGTLNLPSDIELPGTDYAGNPRVWGESVDMGAYEYGPWVKIPDTGEMLSVQSDIMLGVYPNPFRFMTEIKYQTSRQGQVKIELYSLQGMKLGCLVDVSSSSCQGRFWWDGTDHLGKRLDPGTYVLQLTLDSKLTQSVKVIKN